MYTKSLERLKGIVDPADKVPIEKFLSVENLRLAMALIFSLKINFYLTNHRVGQGEFVGVGRKMWNFACNADKGTDTDHTHRRMHGHLEDRPYLQHFWRFGLHVRAGYFGPACACDWRHLSLTRTLW